MNKNRLDNLQLLIHHQTKPNLKIFNTWINQKVCNILHTTHLKATSMYSDLYLP